MNDFDHTDTDNIVCPHCGYEDGDSWEHSNGGETNCLECEKPFKFSRTTTITYSTEKIENTPTTPAERKGAE